MRVHVLHGNGNVQTVFGLYLEAPSQFQTKRANSHAPATFPKCLQISAARVSGTTMGTAHSGPLEEVLLGERLRRQSTCCGEQRWDDIYVRVIRQRCALQCIHNVWNGVAVEKPNT